MTSSGHTPMSPDRLNSMTHEACFALGALCVLIPLCPALEASIAQRTRAEVRALNPPRERRGARIAFGPASRAGTRADRTNPRRYRQHAC